MTSRRNRSNRSERDRARFFSFDAGRIVGAGLLSFACVGAAFPDFGDSSSPLVFAQNLQIPQTPTSVGRAQNSGAKGQVVFFSIPVVADAPVFAGPRDDAYRTGTLAKGRFVEVYFRTADGWCAIRPPQGSFSWVNAKFVVPDAEPFGRIATTGGKAVPVRVDAGEIEGSSLVQVGLKNGRRVKIVDRATLPNGSTWVKILPPPGEFRWIRETSLTPDPALAKLPTKPTFQNEFLAEFAASETANSTESSRFAEPFDSSRSTNPSSSIFLPSSPRSSINDDSAAKAADFAETVEPLDAATFRAEAARLNVDVFRTTRQEQISDAELAALASRAETLFDAAPSDDDRVFVQSIYDAIKIAEQTRPTTPRLAQANAEYAEYNGDAFNNVYANAPLSANPAFSNDPNDLNDPSGLNGLNNSNGYSNGYPNDFSTNVPPNGGVYASSANFAGGGESIAFDGANGFLPQEGGVYQTTPDGRLVPFDASNLGGDFNANPADAPSTFASETPAPANDSTSKSRLSFAFSSLNNPFSSSRSKNVRVATESTRKTSASGGTAKLPSLFPSRERLIVPPPNYRSTPLGAAPTRQNAKLVAAGVRRKTERDAETAKNAQTAQTAQIASSAATTNAAKVAQTATTNAQAAKIERIAQIAQTTEEGAVWRAVDGTPASDLRAETKPRVETASNPIRESNPNPIVPTTASTPKTTTPEERAKIRPANAFAPIAIESSNVFDASGTLVYLPNAPEGAPKFALVRPSGKKYDVVSYLEADDEVRLSKHVGKKVGVQGTTGTIQINETTRNLTIVRAVFPI